MGGEQDMRKMGGLRKKIPVTFCTMFVATLAIAGAPGFSGFFSKDEILDAARSGPYANLVLYVARRAHRGPHFVLHVPPVLPDVSSAQPRYDEHNVHVHESPRNMMVPLIVLAILSVGGGWLAAPQLVGGVNHFDNFLSPVFGGAAEPLRRRRNRGRRNSAAGALLGAPVIAGLLGFLLAWWFYIRSPSCPKRIAESLARALPPASAENILSTNSTRAVIVRPLVWISRNVLWHVVDERVIDGTVNGVARGSARSRRPAAPPAIPATRAATPPGSSWAPWCSPPCCSGWCADVQQSYLLSVLTFLPLAGTAALLLLRATITSGFAASRWPLSLCRIRAFAAASARLRPRHRRLSVRGIPRLDSPAADSLSPGRRRHQPVSGPADHVADADCDSGVLEIDRRSA